MALELLDHLSLPGDPAKPNEDSFAFFDRGALVLDGATPLGPPLLPGPSDALWIAQFGARRLLAHLKDDDDAGDALRHALADAEKSFAGLARAPIREKWQTPCASLMMAVEVVRDEAQRVDQGAGASWSGISPPASRSDWRGEMSSEGARRSKWSAGPFRPLRGRGSTQGRQRAAKIELEFLWFGDCSALVEQDGHVEIVGEGLKARGEEAGRARYVARQMNLESALGVERPEILPLLRAARNRINGGRNWLFSPDRRAAAHVSRSRLQVSPGARLLIASDGFLALVSDYGAYDAPSLMAAIRHKGLKALGQELRAIEQDDRGARKFPRFKTSDDATALLLQLA